MIEIDVLLGYQMSEYKNECLIAKNKSLEKLVAGLKLKVLRLEDEILLHVHNTNELDRWGDHLEGQLERRKQELETKEKLWLKKERRLKRKIDRLRKHRMEQRL